MTDKYNLTDMSSIKKILSRNGFSFKKALGQNFIIDPFVCPEMADAAELDDETGVLEIGPGIGVLTVELAKRAKKVLAVELDSSLIPVLNDTLSECENVEIINGDILKLDLESLLSSEFEGCKKINVVANLPYYVTSPIIMSLLEGGYNFDCMTFMVQKEAGERFCAPVGSRESGAITVAVNYYAASEILFEVTRDKFMPSPKVDSVVIALKRRAEPEFKFTDVPFFFRVVKAAFSQRRKTAKNGISSGLGIPKEQIDFALKECGIDTNIRAEKMTMEQLFEFTESLYSIVGGKDV